MSVEMVDLPEPENSTWKPVDIFKRRVQNYEPTKERNGYRVLMSIDGKTYRIRRIEKKQVDRFKYEYHCTYQLMRKK